MIDAGRQNARHPPWFTPRPWTTPVVDVDLRRGGRSHMIFRGPDGVYLEVVPPQRLIFTDAYVEAWRPSSKPFITAIISFTEEGGGTRYEAGPRRRIKLADLACRL